MHDTASSCAISVDARTGKDWTTSVATSLFLAVGLCQCLRTSISRCEQCEVSDNGLLKRQRCPITTSKGTGLFVYKRPPIAITKDSTRVAEARKVCTHLGKHIRSCDCVPAIAGASHSLLQDTVLQLLVKEKALLPAVGGQLPKIRCSVGERRKKRRGRRYCCVFDCHNQEGVDSSVTFYSFPTRSYETERRQRWIQAVRRVEPDGRPWQPNANTRICSRHFFGNAKSNRMSHPSYVPTIFPPAYHHSGPAEHRWTEQAGACMKSLENNRASQRSERRDNNTCSLAGGSHRQPLWPKPPNRSNLEVPSTEEHSTNISIMTSSSTPDNSVNAEATLGSESSALSLVQVHLLQPPDVEQVFQNTSSITERKKKHRIPSVTSDLPSTSAVSPTAQFASVNLTAKPLQQPLPFAKKVDILADVRAGKLSKAEIVYKYHIRWAVLYEVIKAASEIDAALKCHGLTPEKRDSHLVSEAHGFKGKLNTTKAQESPERMSATPGAFFVSEDLYFNPPKKHSRQPGSRPKKYLLPLDVPSASPTSAETIVDNLDVASPTATTIKVGKAGCSKRKKRAKPVARTMHTVSMQTVSSSGRGSLITFLSTTNGTDAMTQVNHRRQADKGSGTATQQFQKLPPDLNTEGDCKGLFPPEFSRHFHKVDDNDYNAACVKDDTVRRPQAPPTLQPKLVDSASSSTPAESSSFSLLKVKQEIVQGSDTEEIVFDPHVVPKQEPCSPQGGDCDDFVMECDEDVEHSGEQNFQLPQHNVINAVSQWDDVNVKREPSLL
ncbi:uncharacterized protein [Dermacentor albipictus]|uniref:uncharacterized protein isoform X3 n=1 Tax=Dermacentor albipictus TaxID=60249 RepID=UPI0038FC538C